jgi:hypothetical protein
MFDPMASTKNTSKRAEREAVHAYVQDPRAGTFHVLIQMRGFAKGKDFVQGQAATSIGQVRVLILGQDCQKLRDRG